MEFIKNQQAFELLDKLFGSVSGWGGKGYLVDRVARECGITKVEATRQFEAWAEQKAQ